MDTTNASLIKAIRLKCENCYGAMSFANALGGYPSPQWILCHSYSLKDLLEEAKNRKLDLSQISTEIDPILPIIQTLYYKRATGEMTEKEFRREFSKWKRGK
jgi:hypothetical protein